ncbi:MAG: helix-turn-helix domain-containing protein [Alsobacter sp.]
MRTSDRHLIRGFPIFRGVSDAMFDRMTLRAEIFDVDPGEVLLKEGEEPRFLFVLLNGLVEAYAAHGGVDATLSFIRPPGAFIVAAVWTGQVQLTSVRVVRRSRLLRLPAGEVRDAIAADAAVASAVGLELAIRYRDILRELKNQRMRSATERLANWLLVESEVAGSASFRLEIGKALLAARLGMASEHLSRAFATLRDHGVSMTGNDVTIDRDALARFAKPSVLMDGHDI